MSWFDRRSHPSTSFVTFFLVMIVVAGALAAPAQNLLRRAQPDSSGLSRYSAVYMSLVGSNKQATTSTATRVEDVHHSPLNEALKGLNGMQDPESASWSSFQQVWTHLQGVKTQTHAWLTGALHPASVGTQDQTILTRLVLKYGELNRRLNNEMTAIRLSAVSPGQWKEIEELRSLTRIFQFVGGHALNLLDSRRETFEHARNEVKQALGIAHF